MGKTEYSLLIKGTEGGSFRVLTVTLIKAIMYWYSVKRKITLFFLPLAHIT